MISNVVVNTWHGTMIVNRFDQRVLENNRYFGVGAQLLAKGSFDKPAIELVTKILKTLQELKGAPITAFDLGANIGCHCLVWSRELQSEIRIVAVEAQSQVFYQLCGNISLNNLRNIRAMHAAVGAETGVLTFQVPDYTRPGSYGSLELKQDEGSENIGQVLSEQASETVPMVRLSDLTGGEVDFIKLDVEGMEAEVLYAAEAYLAQHKPVLHYEHIKLKAEKEPLERFLEKNGYRVVRMQMDTLAVPENHLLNGRLNIVRK